MDERPTIFERIPIFLITIAALLIAVSLGLWAEERRSKVDDHKAIDGKYLKARFRDDDDDDDLTGRVTGRSRVLVQNDNNDTDDDNDDNNDNNDNNDNDDNDDNDNDNDTDDTDATDDTDTPTGTYGTVDTDDTEDDT